MPATDTDETYYAALALYSRSAAEQVQKAWRDLDPAALRATFPAVAQVFTTAVAQGQSRAASLATPYVAASVGAEQDSQVAPDAFTGWTAAGMPLDVLAQQPLFQMLAMLAGGAAESIALASGLNAALTYTQTEVADAGRTALQAQMISDYQNTAGHERVVHLPACDRCIILSGKFYRYSTGFQRHPRCDCTMRPVTRDEWMDGTPVQSPTELFASMSAEQQAKAFGAANAEAIRAGADMSQVVNARQGAMQVAGEWTTKSGTTSRGLAGQRMGNLAKQPGERYRRSTLSRPTAGQIIKDSAGRARSEVIDELYRYGYVLRR